MSVARSVAVTLLLMWYHEQLFREFVKYPNTDAYIAAQYTRL